MGLITLNTIDSKEEAALAHYRESQRGEQTADGAVTSSPPSSATSQQSSGSPPASVTYTVRRGDTLRGIADWFYGDRGRSQALYAANRSRIRDPEELEAGTVLLIPRQSGASPLH
jgi:nucleoid-associated protein YgaU